MCPNFKKEMDDFLLSKVCFFAFFTLTKFWFLLLNVRITKETGLSLYCICEKSGINFTLQLISALLLYCFLVTNFYFFWDIISQRKFMHLDFSIFLFFFYTSLDWDWDPGFIKFQQEFDSCLLDWRTTSTWNGILNIFQHNHIYQGRWKNVKQKCQWIVVLQSGLLLKVGDKFCL